MTEPQHILVRLPNWLGDMVMASSFVQALQNQYPQASIDFITKKGIDFLLDYFPIKSNKYIFDKQEHKGILGVLKFGLAIKKQKKYDLFFCLPTSLSAALMGKAIAAKKRIGFKKSMHSIFFTQCFSKKQNVHRVEEYVDLLSQFFKENLVSPNPIFINKITTSNNSIVININSEANSRRLPISKAVSIINKISEQIPNDIILIGSPKEKLFVDAVFEKLNNKNNITNLAGKTNMPQLIDILSSCKAILTTDSGPAHVSNALLKNTIVLFGAGNEKNTSPYNKRFCKVIRLGALPCEPCVKNKCNLYPEPKCLLQLDEDIIVEELKRVI